jgi:hypothetical protein
VHDVVLNDGTVYPATGEVARVSATFSEVDSNGFCKQSYGEIVNLPEPVEDTYYLVSALVFNATDREDVVAPATGHPLCKRNDKGQIISVPCLLKH